MNDSVDLLEGLLQIYSPSYLESDAVAYLVAKMNALGMRAYRDEAGNAVGIMDPPTMHSSRLARNSVTGEMAPAKEDTGVVSEIVMLGHIDTAPGVVEVRREGGNEDHPDLLFGRGAVDAKGPLCAFVSAAARVGPREGWRIVVVGAVEEECPTSKGAHFAKTQFDPRFAIIGEPSGWDRVTLGYKGSLWVNSTHIRSMAHSAGRFKSAPETAVEFWLAIKNYAEDFNRDKVRVFEKLDPTLRGMSSNSDGLEEVAKLSIGLRLPIGVEVADLERSVLELADGADVQFSTEIPAFRAEKNNALVRAFLASIRAGGGEPGFTLKTGTSDMNILGPYWQCPIVTYGPGDSDLDHTPNEHIVVREYENSIGVLQRVLETLTSPA